MLTNVKKGERVIVAMSGGVDSSVAACMMVEAGYDVVGITLQLYDHGEMIQKKGACCAGQDIYDAKLVADKMGFPHYVLDYESLFGQNVIDDFADSYLRGETPIPCIRCNQKVKFKDLLKTSKDLGGKALVTGHYVQWHHNGDHAELHRAVDPIRDQSYFLFTTTQDQLDYLRFPLGGFENKNHTRDLAKKYGLQVAEKPDSQDICFVPDGHYADLVKKLRPKSTEKGHIVHKDGTVLGDHNGIIHYTIGQRKGLGISYHEPLYVVDIDPNFNRVIVGSKTDLAKQEIPLKEVNFLKGPWDFEKGYDCTVKIRSTHDPIPATVTRTGAETAKVLLHTPEYGVSPGQACVFYRDSQVLGGGWITKM